MDRYMELAHAMQSGVAAEISLKGEHQAGASPKYLRVGINSAFVNDDGLATLLVEKGIITREEYVQAITDAMQREVDRYEKLLGCKLG